MFKVFYRRAISDQGYRFRSFRIYFLIISAGIMRFSILAFARGRISYFTIIFRVGPITRVTAIAMSKRVLSFRSVLSGRQGRFFQRIMQAMIIKTANGHCQRFVDIIMDRCRRIYAYLEDAMQTIEAGQDYFDRVPFNSR